MKIYTSDTVLYTKSVVKHFDILLKVWICKAVKIYKMATTKVVITMFVVNLVIIY